MTGLDRAAVWCELEVDTDLVTIGIRKTFPKSNPKKLAGNTQSYLINYENINEIRVKEKISSTMIKIDFSYSRANRSDNVYPLDSELGKIIVEEQILKIIEKITLQEVTRERLFYEYIEYSIQEEVKSFYAFYNIISCFYRGLTREIQSKNRSQFTNYDSNLDFYYSTGFIYQLVPGWKMRLYSKTHENNKKSLEKIKTASIRLEHRLNQSMLKNIFKNNKVINLTIAILEKELDRVLGEKLLDILKRESFRDIEILKQNFKNFKSRELDKLIRDNQEHILDEKIIHLVIVLTSDKQERQIRRYKNKVTEILKDFQIRGSPRRDNLGNIERLEFFINKILKINIKVNCEKNSELILNFT